MDDEELKNLNKHSYTYNCRCPDCCGYEFELKSRVRRDRIEEKKKQLEELISAESEEK